jgi:hypothetical protein
MLHGRNDGWPGSVAILFTSSYVLPPSMEAQMQDQGALLI